MKLRIFALLLTVVMIVGMLPISAMAAIYSEPLSNATFIRNNDGGSDTKNVGDTGFYQRLPRLTNTCTKCGGVATEDSPTDYYGCTVELSNPEILSDCKFTMGSWKGAGDYANLPCFEFDYTAAKAGTTDVKLTFYYQYDSAATSGYCANQVLYYNYYYGYYYYDSCGQFLNIKSNNNHYYETATFTVTVAGDPETQSVTLSYNANGGSGAPAAQSQTVTNGESATFTVSDTVPTLKGCTFLGWADTPGATTVQYQAGETITTAANKTIYAVWDGEPEPPAKPEVSYINKYVYTLCNDDWVHSVYDWVVGVDYTVGDVVANPGTTLDAATYPWMCEATLDAQEFMDVLNRLYSTGDPTDPWPLHYVSGDAPTFNWYYNAIDGEWYYNTNEPDWKYASEKGWNYLRINMTCTHQPVDPPVEETYTVTYTDGDETEVIFADQVHENLLSGTDTPAFETENADGKPTREGYVFKGWEPEVADTVTKTVTYVAQWGEDTNNNGEDDATEEKFTVTYTDGDETEVIFADQVHENLLSGTDTPAFETENADGKPTREGYVFNGWEPEVADTVTKTVTYVAQWGEDTNNNGKDDATEDKFTVTWMNGEEELEKDVNVLENTKPSYDSAEPTKTADGYTYTFAGWSTNKNATADDAILEEDLSKVTEDVTYYAIFAETVNTHTLTWDFNGGEAGAEDYTLGGEVAVGTEIKYPTVTKPGYGFNGWTPANVTTMPDDDLTLTANWFEDANGDGIDDAGQTWRTITINTGDLKNVPVALIVNKRQTNSTDDHVPLWEGKTDENGTVTVPAEDLATVANNQLLYAIVNDSVNYKWDNPPTNAPDGTPDRTATAVNGVTVYTAVTDDNNQYLEITNSQRFNGSFGLVNIKELNLGYTVTWVDEDGTELEVDEKVPAGTMPEYNGDNPVKESTDEYTYEFAGWTPEPSEVTADITYTAVYEAIANEYTLTVNYTGAFGLTPAAHTEQVAFDAEYSVKTPDLDGYEADRDVVEGTMPAADVDVTVTYTCIHEKDAFGICSDPDCNHSDDCTCSPDVTDGKRTLTIISRDNTWARIANVPVVLMMNPNTGWNEEHTKLWHGVTNENGNLDVPADVLENVLPGSSLYVSVAPNEDGETTHEWAWTDLAYGKLRTVNAIANVGVTQDEGKNEYAYIAAGENAGFTAEIFIYVVEAEDASPIKGIVNFVIEDENGTLIDEDTQIVMGLNKRVNGKATHIGTTSIIHGEGKIEIDAAELARLPVGTILDCDPTVGHYEWALGDVDLVRTMTIDDGAIVYGNNVNHDAKITAESLEKGFEITFHCVLRSTEKSDEPEIPETPAAEGVINFLVNSVNGESVNGTMALNMRYNGKATVIGTATIEDGVGTLTLDAETLAKLPVGAVLDCDPGEGYAWALAECDNLVRTISDMTGAITQGTNANHDAMVTAATAANGFAFTFHCTVK